MIHPHLRAGATSAPVGDAGAFVDTHSRSGGLGVVHGAGGSRSYERAAIPERLFDHAASLLSAAHEGQSFSS